VQEMAIGAGRAPYMEEGILVGRAPNMVHVYVQLFLGQQQQLTDITKGQFDVAVGNSEKKVKVKGKVRKKNLKKQ
jgi:hypothetical protein